MLTENLGLFLADFGQPCVATATSYAFTGILDTPDESMTMAGVAVLSTMYQLTARSSDVQAAGIASGAAITVGARPFVVRDVMLQDDGAFTTLTLSA